MKRLSSILFLGLMVLWAHAAPDDTDINIKIPSRPADNKFLYISNVDIDFNKEDSIEYFAMAFLKFEKNKSEEQKMDETEAAYRQRKDRAEAFKERLDGTRNNPSKEKLDNDDSTVRTEYSSFDKALIKELKNSGYIDTVNRIFQDENNTNILEGKISHIEIFTVSGYKNNPCCENCYLARIKIKWIIKNHYREILDSFATTGISDHFYRESGTFLANMQVQKFDISDQKFEKMVGSAVVASCLNLLNSDEFKKYQKKETETAIVDPPLKLTRPANIVTEKADAVSAAVIVKRDDQGHGSGFAITQDGYILTNYHVVATENPSKQATVKVILTDGQEVEAKLIRFNKWRDVALLKVEKNFEKAFLLESEKKFKNLEDVFTMGAPKSIELGQTMTAGLISNERNSNNHDLLQLSMPVNFGNSGGPLFNEQGTLHGVIVSKLVGKSTEGISFAIPAYKIGEYLNINY